MRRKTRQRTLGIALALLGCGLLLLADGWTRVAPVAGADSTQPQPQQPGTTQQQPSQFHDDDPSHAPPHLRESVAMRRGVLRPLPRDYEPPTVEDLVAPPLSGGQQPLQPQAQQEQGQQQVAQQQQQQQPPMTLSSRMESVEEMQVRAEEDSQGRHLYASSSTTRVTLPREQQQQQQQQQPQQQQYASPGVVLPREDDVPPHHLDPLVETLKTEIKHLHHRLHEEHELREAEMRRQPSKQREHYGQALQQEASQLNNLTMILAEHGSALHPDVRHSALTLLEICTNSARQSLLQVAEFGALSSAQRLLDQSARTQLALEEEAPLKPVKTRAALSEPERGGPKRAQPQHEPLERGAARSGLHRAQQPPEHKHTQQWTFRAPYKLDEQRAPRVQVRRHESDQSPAAGARRQREYDDRAADPDAQERVAFRRAALNPVGEGYRRIADWTKRAWHRAVDAIQIAQWA